MAVGTTNFPTSLDTITELVEVTNNASSALSASITATDTTIGVSDIGEFPSSGFATLADNLTTPTKIEIISYTGKSGSNLTGVTRGVQGTSGQEFSSGFAEVRPTAGHHEALRGAILAIETKLGTGSTIAVNKLATLTASRAVVTDASGYVSTSSVTSTELGYLSGVTSAIQTQLNAKGAGTVTSVALSLPALFTVSGSPITTTGTITATLATQTANTVFAGPTTGSAAAPTFRALVAGDIPALSYASTGAVTSSGLTMSTARLLGRSTASTGAIEEITVGTGLTLSGGTLSATGGGGSGSVTSVGLSMPSIFTVSGSPVTSSGTLTATLATQVANRVFAGPETGTDAAPTFRELSDNDIPNILSIHKNSHLTTNGFVKTSGGDGTLSVDTATYLTANQTITLSGDISGSGATSITTTIGANKVTLAMMAQIATARFLGRTTASTGNVESLTGTQATALLDAFTGDAGSGGLKGLVPAPAAGDSGKYLRGDGTWVAVSGGGGGTVTSVALSMPSIFSVSGSPVTTSGTLTASLNAQTANTVFGGPSSGSSAVPTFRSLVDDDVPSILTLTKISGLTSNGFVKTSGGDGTLSVDTTTYLSGAAGSNRQVQFNSSGTLTGAAGFEYQSAASPNVKITAQATNYTPLTVNGAASQSAALQTWTVNDAARITFTASGDIYLPRGLTSTAAGTGRIYATGGSGTDSGGGYLALYGGASTGTGLGGSLLVYTTAPSTTGSSANAAVLRLEADTYGNFIVNPGPQGLATTATDGFLHLPSAAGVPTGVPSTAGIYTNTEAVTLDRTNYRLYAYLGGSWRNLTGISGNQTITLSGDVSGSGTTAITTTIGANKVTLAMLAQIATARFLGRTSASTGDVESLTGTQATALLDAFTGDSGSGGVKGLVPAPAAGDSGKYLKGDGTWGAVSGSGTVTSVALSLPAIFTVSGSPVTTTGTLTGTLATQTANTLFAGPTTGSAAAPTFRAMVAADVPDALITYAKIQNVSATSRALGRKTAGAGSVEELTLSELLDFIGSAAQGDILYRGASSWARLGAGTSGQYLQTQGAGANPQWATVSGGGGGGSPAGSGSELQYRVDASTFGAVTGSSVSSGQITLADKATVTLDNATTNARDALLDLQHSSSGTVAANFGAEIRCGLESTTTTNRFAGAIGWRWSTATDSSRVSEMTISLRNTTSGDYLAGVFKTVNTGSDGLILEATNELRFNGSSGTGAFIRLGSNFSHFALSSGSFWGATSNSGDPCFNIFSNRLGVGITFDTATTQLEVSTYSTSVGAFLARSASGSTVPTATITHTPNTTNTIATHTRFYTRSSTTAATGLGGRLLFGLESSTTDDQDAAAITWSWSDATHASRTARVNIDLVGNAAALATVARFDMSTTAGDTRFLIYDVDNATLERVTVGAADSGGTGFKVLRIPN
jgi:hypothetical protein